MERLPLNFFNNIPTVTKIWALGTILTSALVYTDLLSVVDIVYIPESTFTKRQYWRVITSFLYLGDLDISLLITVSNFSHTLIRLETSFYKTKDFLWFLFLTYVLILIHATFINRYSLILGGDLICALNYYSSRKNPNEMMALFNLVEFRACYFVIFKTIIDILLRGSINAIWLDSLGLIVGHILFYFEDVFKTLHGFNPLSPPWEWNLTFNRPVQTESNNEIVNANDNENNGNAADINADAIVI